MRRACRTPILYIHFRRRLVACARSIGHGARSRPPGAPFISTGINFRTFFVLRVPHVAPARAEKKCSRSAIFSVWVKRKKFHAGNSIPSVGFPGLPSSLKKIDIYCRSSARAHCPKMGQTEVAMWQKRHVAARFLPPSDEILASRAQTSGAASYHTPTYPQANRKATNN